MSAETSNAQSTRVSQVRLVLILMLTGLTILTVYLLYNGRSSYQIQVFKTSTGWGYDILNDGKLFIHQPTIPGQSGTVGFATQEQARQVGEWVVRKVQETKALPTLTNDELRQLGVKIP